MLLDIDFEYLIIVRYIPPLTNSLYQVLSPRGYLTATYFTVLLSVYHVVAVLNPFKALPCVYWQRSYQIGTGRQGRTRLHYRLLRRVSLRFTFWSWGENNNSHSPSDIVPLNFGYKKMREIIRRMPSYRGEVSAGHPRFPEGSAAVCREVSGPVDLNAPDIVYTPEDDEAIDSFHRDHSKSLQFRIPAVR